MYRAPLWLAARAGVEGIANEVDDDLAQLHLVRQQRGQIGSHFGREAEAMSTGFNLGQDEGFRDEIV